MKYEIQYIKWKNLSTKNINDKCISWFFECSVDTWYKIQKQFNSILKLELEWNWIINQFDCTICQEMKKPISFNKDSAMVKLDIFLPNLSLLWTIFESTLYLIID
jgi:hypothetical protein